MKKLLLRLLNLLKIEEYKKYYLVMENWEYSVDEYISTDKDIAEKVAETYNSAIKDDEVKIYVVSKSAFRFKSKKKVKSFDRNKDILDENKQ